MAPSTDIVERIADIILENHMDLMTENKRLQQENQGLQEENDWARKEKAGLQNTVLELRNRVTELETWVENVATDSQLDTPVPALGGNTGRELLAGKEDHAARKVEGGDA